MTLLKLPSKRNISNKAKGKGKEIKGLAPLVFSYLKSKTSAPLVSEGITSKRSFVYFGKDNYYTYELRELVDNCAPLATCVQVLAQHMAGKGLTFLDENGDPHEEAIRRWDELMVKQDSYEFVFRTALDAAFMNAANWDIRRAVGGGIGAIDHKDVAGFRFNKRNADGDIELGWYSWNWKKRTRQDYKPLELKMYSHATGIREQIETLYIGEYKQLRSYYSEPHYLGAVKDAMVWAEIASGLYNDSSAGFMPSMWVHVPSKGTDVQLDEAEDAIRRQYTGPEAQSVVVTFSQPGVEEKPHFEKLDRGNVSETYSKVRDMAADCIYEGFGLPKILVAEMPSGLAAQNRVIKEKLDLFYSRLVRPKQEKFLIMPIKKLMASMGIDCQPHIIPMEVLSDDVAKSEVSTINELRASHGLEEVEGGEVIYGKGQTNNRATAQEGDGA